MLIDGRRWPSLRESIKVAGSSRGASFGGWMADYAVPSDSYTATIFILP